MNQPSKHLLSHYAILPIILTAFALRVWQVDAQALSGDEAFSIIIWTRTSLEWLLTEIAVTDPQPPIAMLSLVGWVRLVGDSVLAARMLSVLAGTLAVAAAYILAAQLFGRQIAIIAAATVALNPFLIWHSQDLRSYGLWIGLSALSLAALVRALRHSSFLNWTLYVTVATLAVYTYYLEVFLLIVHNGYAFTHIIKNRHLAFKWIISQLTIALMMAPWFLQPILRQSGYQPTAGAPDILGAFQAFLFGLTLSPELRYFQPIPIIPTLVPSFVLILILTALVLVIRRFPLKATSLIIAATLVPMIALAVLAWSTDKGYFHPRYIAGSVISTLILIATLATPSLNQNTIAKIARVLVLAAVWGLSIASLISYRTDPRLAKAPQWPAIVNLLDQQTNPDDLIIQNYPDPAFTYYYTGSVERQTLPDAENTSPQQTIRQLEIVAAQHDYIWFVPVESDVFDRERVVSTWLDANMQLISEQKVGATRILQYGNWDRTQPEIELTSAPNSDTVTELRGYRLTPSEEVMERGSTIHLELFWEPTTTSDMSLKFYVHLIGPEMPDGSPLWAQDDHYPQFGRIDSMNWLPHKIFPDVYRITIPLHAPPGQYWLTTGVYNPETNQRIPLTSNTNPIDAASITILSFRLP